MRRSLKGAICGIMLLTMAGLAFAEFTTPDDAIGKVKVDNANVVKTDIATVNRPTRRRRPAIPAKPRYQAII